MQNTKEKEHNSKKLVIPDLLLSLEFRFVVFSKSVDIQDETKILAMQVSKVEYYHIKW